MESGVLLVFYLCPLMFNLSLFGELVTNEAMS